MLQYYFFRLTYLLTNSSAIGVELIDNRTSLLDPVVYVDADLYLILSHENIYKYTELPIYVLQSL